MKTYRGRRTLTGAEVTVDGQPLDERTDLKRFSSSGFEWAQVGNAPKQLALALLADHLDDTVKALTWCDPFMRQVVAKLDTQWMLTTDDIDEALANIMG